MRGSSVPVLARSPVWWHFILPGDSALERLGTAHTHWLSSSSGACHHQERRCDGSECAGLAGAVLAAGSCPAGNSRLGFLQPWLSSRLAQQCNSDWGKGVCMGPDCEGLMASLAQQESRTDVSLHPNALPCASLCFLGLEGLIPSLLHLWGRHCSMVGTWEPGRAGTGGKIELQSLSVVNGPKGYELPLCMLPPCTHAWQGAKRTELLVALSPSLSPSSMSPCFSSSGATPASLRHAHLPHLLRHRGCRAAEHLELWPYEVAVPGWVLLENRRVQADV